MARHAHALLTLIALMLVVAPGLPPTRASRALAEPQSPIVAQTAAPTLIALPGGCGGGLPPRADATAAVCCMFGYVFLDGEAVEGARVTVSNARGSVEAWTTRGPDSPWPYFRLSLSAPPLRAVAGETVTVSVTYAGHRRSFSHIVLADGQQVDAVLPRNQPDDHTFDEQIWQQAEAGLFNYPVAVAVDGSGTAYVVDRDNARVQVFTARGELLRQWGELGSLPGQFVTPAGIAVDRHGTVYVADTGNHRIQLFSTDGEWLESWGDPWAAEVGAPRGITVDGADAIYVTAGNHVLKLDAAGGELERWGGAGTGPGQFDSPYGVAVDGAGTIYVADRENHRLQRRTSADGMWQVFGDMTTYTFPAGLALDGEGNLYVADGGYGGQDSGNHRILKLGLDGALVESWGGVKGGAPGQFAFPDGLAVSDEGIYVADTYNHRVQVLSFTGEALDDWGSRGRDAGQFARPSAIAIGPDGRRFVADTVNNRLLIVAPDGEVVDCWGPASTSCKPATLNHPVGVAVDAAGQVYVTEEVTHRVQKFSPSGGLLAQWGGLGANPGQFNGPRGVAVDGAVVYVADGGNGRLQRFSTTGTFLGCWGGTSPCSAANLVRPFGVVVSTGGIYVSDASAGRIVRFNQAGEELGRWGAPGSQPGELSEPAGLATDAAGNIYVADRLNSRVQKFDATGTWLGSISERGGGPGQIARPFGVAVGADGRLYVADSDNNRIQIFRPMSMTAPIATIVRAAPRTVAAGEPVSLHGTGGDSDATPEVTATEWFLDGSLTPFATTLAATLTTGGLSPGRHTISFRVQDAEGEYSAPQHVTIAVSLAATPAVRWTFLLYLDGDSAGTAPFLDPDSPLGALYRLINLSPNPAVQVAALYDGPQPGGGDSARYWIGPDGHATREALGEVNMGDPQTLVDFVRWAQGRAPTEHYYLALADHANALDGIALDTTSVPQDYLNNTEIRQALVAITDNGAHPIDVLHFDGCLMGLVESAYQVRGLTEILVSSESLAWSAFAYDAYRAAVGPTTDARGLGAAIVERYGERVGADGNPYTIAALDITALDPAIIALDTLAGELQRFALAAAPNRAALSAIREQAQHFDSDGDYTLSEDDEYIDLDSWAELLARDVDDARVREAAAALRGSLSAVVVHERHRSGRFGSARVDLDGARGIAIFYPPRLRPTTYETYVRGGLTMPVDTRWDEFLAAALAAVPLGPEETEPALLKPLTHSIHLPLIQR